MGEPDLIERMSDSAGKFELEKGENTVLLWGGCAALTQILYRLTITLIILDRLRFLEMVVAVGRVQNIEYVTRKKFIGRLKILQVLYVYDSSPD